MEVYFPFEEGGIYLEWRRILKTKCQGKHAKGKSENGMCCLESGEGPGGGLPLNDLHFLSQIPFQKIRGLVNTMLVTVCGVRTRVGHR